MKKVIRLTESDLVRLVKRVIKEEAGPKDIENFLIQKGFEKQNKRFEGTLRGERTMKLGPYSSENSLVYKKSCKSDSKFSELRGGSPRHEVYVEIDSNRIHLILVDYHKDNTLKGAYNETVGLDLDKLKSVLKFQRDFNGYGC